jgi:hypothetical protein
VTLILPSDITADKRFKCVGELNRIEADEIIIGYDFELRDNKINSKKTRNENAGKEHKFKAFRLKSQSNRAVILSNNPHGTGIANA